MSLELNYKLLITSSAIILTSYILSKLLILVSPKLALIAPPNHRTMHDQDTPNSGGIAIFSAFLLGNLLFGHYLNSIETLTLFLTLLLGIHDDRHNIKSSNKLIILIAITLILVFNGYAIQSLGVFLDHPINLPLLASQFVLVFSIVGFINAMNLTDGLDGLASIIGIIIISSFAYMGFKYNDSFLFYSALSYILSLLGFLILNWKPAKIFMGDNGSMVLGLFIAIISMHAIKQDYVSPVSVLLLAGIPILDTLIVLIRRISIGKNPLVADRTHIHHIILRQQRNNITRTVIIIALIQLLSVVIGLGFKLRDDMVSLLAFILMFVVFYLLLTPTKK